MEVTGATPGCSASKVRIAPAIQRHGGHLRAGDHLADLRAGGVHVELIINDRDGIGPGAHFEDRVDIQCAVGIEDDSGALIRAEAVGYNVQIVAADLNVEEGEGAVIVGGEDLAHTGFCVGDGDGGFGNHGAGRVFHGTGDASADAGACGDGQNQ